MTSVSEYEEDSVTVRCAEIGTLSLVTSPVGGARICSKCNRRQTTEFQSVPVQTVRPPTDNMNPPVKLMTNCNDQVLVSREQLIFMRKYYMAVKDAYYNYVLSDGDSNEVVRKLFEQTPEVLCVTDQHGQSPIESALAQGKVGAGAQLLDLAGRKNSRALHHRTAAGEDAMMLAVTSGSEATVRQLVSLGCAKDACLHYDARGRNSLHLCALGSSSQVLEILLSELSDLLSRGRLSLDCVTAALSTSDRDGCTPLHYMARRNQTQMLRAVHEFSQGRIQRLDWDAPAVGDCRLTPLAMAVEANSLEACEFLLKHGLAGIDLYEHRDLWLQLQAISDSARALLGQHCRLLEPMSALPSGNLVRLQSGLQEQGLTEEFLLKLRTHWPELPQLPTVVTVLAVCQNFSGSCRLVVWDILTGLDRTGELARLLEA